MFFKASEKLRNSIHQLLADYFTEEELNKGLNAFENLINITDDSSNFDQDRGLFKKNRKNQGQ